VWGWDSHSRKWENGVLRDSQKLRAQLQGSNLLAAKCEDGTHTPESEKMESSGTPKNLELNCRGQISLHLRVLSLIGKVLKCRCPKWPRMSHLDICSPSYGQKKGKESIWQFDFRPLKVGNQPFPNVWWQRKTWHWKALKENYNFSSDLVSIGLLVGRYELPKSWDSNAG
jgi:hypothetical protein